MKQSKWPPEKTAVLLDLVAQGKSRREIALEMGRDVMAVTSKLRTLRIHAPLNPPGYRAAARRGPAKVNFPRFEDITPTEARLITRDAPRSGKYAYTHPFSLTGNAAARCLL